MKPIALLVALLTVPLSACVSPPPHTSLANSNPVFSPQEFFTGKTIGEGALKIIFSGEKHTHVVGHGHVEPDGTLVLVQRIEKGDKPPRERTWRISPTGNGRFTGSLSDAEGSVSAFVRGNLMHVQFKTTSGFNTEQWLYLQPGGQVALNRMVIRKFGIPIAALEETIRKAD